MGEQAMVSVIIPVYNVEQYLRECVDSVLHQTYQNFEIILVDDGSKDSSPAICDEYAEKDCRIRCIHKENGGASSARNVGMDVAKGEFIFFLDSDDWLIPTALDELYAPMKNIEIDFSFCEAYAIDEDTNEVSERNYGYHRDYGVGLGAELFAEMQKNCEFHVAIWMMLYRKEFLIREKLRFIEKIMYEDCIFAYRAYRQARKVAHVDKYLYYRRYRKNSVMTSKKTAHNFVSAKRAYEEVVVAYNSYEHTASDLAYVVRIAHNAINTYRALNMTERKKYRNEFKQVKNNIIANNAFADRALKTSCYGKMIWVLYKVSDKVFHY